MKKQLLYTLLCVFGASLVMTAQERTRNVQQSTTVVQKENPFTQIQQTSEYRSSIDDNDLPLPVIISNTDAEITGSLCVGSDCNNGESYGFTTIRLKENNLRIGFVDTSITASFPSNDWEITINDITNGGANYFGITDLTAGRRIFTLEADAPVNSLYVDDDGDLGLGTANPVVEIHSVDGNTPTLRLEQDGSEGFTSQTWDIAGNEANFFVRDITNGSALPFRIFPGAGNDDSLIIAANGSIGIGTEVPASDSSLDLDGNNRGLLLNRLTTAERTAFAPSEAGMVVFDTDENFIYSWDGSQWQTSGVDTDDQGADVFQLTATNMLELSLEDDGVATQSVDLSSLDDSGTDDQAISFSGTTLTLEDGGTADLSSLDDSGTDDQAISFAGTTLTLEDGGTVDLSSLDDSGTDNQAISFSGTTLTLEDGGTVDLSSLDDSGTDDQNIAGSGLSGTTLTIGIEGGTSQTVDLSSLNDSGTDDQSLTLSGNTLSLEDGGSVDLSGYLDNTDSQTLGNFILTGDVLGITLQNGGSTQVDLGALVDPLRDDLQDAQNQLANLSAQMNDVLARLDAIEDCACDGTLGLTDFNLKPDQPVLLQNIPNPFDNTTTIGYFIPFKYTSANIVVSATSGRLLDNIKIDRMGEGEITVNKERMQAAVYFYTLYVDGKRIDTKRMVVE